MRLLHVLTTLHRATDPTDYLIKGIHVDPREDDIVCTATTGKILARVTCRRCDLHPDDGEPTDPCIIRIDDPGACLKAAKKPHKLLWGKRGVSLDTPGAVLLLPYIDATYPDPRKVLEEPIEGGGFMPGTAIDPQLLLTVQRMMKELSPYHGIAPLPQYGALANHFSGDMGDQYLIMPILLPTTPNI